MIDYIMIKVKGPSRQTKEVETVTRDGRPSSDFVFVLFFFVTLLLCIRNGFLEFRLAVHPSGGVTLSQKSGVNSKQLAKSDLLYQDLRLHLAFI